MKPLYDIKKLKTEFLEWWKTTQGDPEFETLTREARGNLEFGLMPEIYLFLEN